MKTRLFAAVLLVLAGCSGCAVAASPTPGTTATGTPTQTPSTDEDTILFAQDSVGYGLNATAVERGFRPLVTAGLSQQSPVREIAYGKPGYTVEDTAALVVAPTDLDYAVIELGTNDANKGHDAATFTADYTALLSRITTASPAVKLVCVGTLATFYNSEAFDAIIDSSCAAAGGTFVSIDDITSDPANLAAIGSPVWGGQVSSDGQHPNDAGHALIAERILAAFAADAG